MLDVATILVTDTLESVCTKVATICARASESLFVSVASVHGESHGDFVCLPQINLSAACSILAFAGILICFGWHPTLNVGTAMGPLHVVRALSITVASPILGTSHVTVLGILALATIIVHLYEVHGPIEPQSISASSTVKVNSRCFMWNIL